MIPFTAECNAAVTMRLKIPAMEMLYSMPLWGSKQSH
jgi:hypothetical protein